jgi:hypothetical protein
MVKQKKVCLVKFGHFYKKYQQEINTEYQEDFPDDEKVFNDLIMILLEDLKLLLKKKYHKHYL